MRVMAAHGIGRERNGRGSSFVAARIISTIRAPVAMETRAVNGHS
jgi:hypothetical protein